MSWHIESANVTKREIISTYLKHFKIPVENLAETETFSSLKAIAVPIKKPVSTTDGIAFKTNRKPLLSLYDRTSLSFNTGTAGINIQAKKQTMPAKKV